MSSDLRLLLAQIAVLAVLVTLHFACVGRVLRSSRWVGSGRWRALVPGLGEWMAWRAGRRWLPSASVLLAVAYLLLRLQGGG